MGSNLDRGRKNKVTLPSREQQYTELSVRTPNKLVVECVGPWAQTKAWLACKNVPEMPVLVKKKIGMDLAILVHLLSMGRNNFITDITI